MTEPSSTGDNDHDLTEREVRDARARTLTGAAVAVLAIAAALGYVLTPPGRYHGALLGLAVVAAVTAVTWLYRCGDGHEHRKLRSQNRAILARLAELQAALDAQTITHRQQLAALAVAVDGRLAQLAAKAKADERERHIGTAKVALAETIALAASARERHNGDSLTPAGGLRLVADTTQED